MIIRILAAVGLLTTSAAAHELTPTYPKLRPSFMEGVYVTEMHMWNRRSDVKYYGVGVFDKDMEAIPFATSTKILRLEHLAHLDFDVYIRGKDVDRAVYICTWSKQLKQDVKGTGIQSRICSRFEK